MLILDLFQEWLGEVATAKTFVAKQGHWSTYEDSVKKRYVAFQVVGGSAPREVGTRYAQINLTIVGQKLDTLDAISQLAENVMSYAENQPLQCSILTVNPLGEPLGPVYTKGERPLLNLTLELIT